MVAHVSCRLDILSSVVSTLVCCRGRSQLPETTSIRGHRFNSSVVVSRFWVHLTHCSTLSLQGLLMATRKDTFDSDTSSDVACSRSFASKHRLDFENVSGQHSLFLSSADGIRVPSYGHDVANNGEIMLHHVERPLPTLFDRAVLPQNPLELPPSTQRATSDGTLMGVPLEIRHMLWYLLAPTNTQLCGSRPLTNGSAILSKNLRRGGATLLQGLCLLYLLQESSDHWNPIYRDSRDLRFRCPVLQVHRKSPCPFPGGQAAEFSFRFVR